ncbi:unnamed protein product [Caenorhabditis bovis]|uniref:Ubiquitin-like-conjugating enzyme ATG3 n=1 Tax=Caenorhabditis bovis TaxID=2654633 RepID=A0A8S1EXN0_9PELO|nr:unnamed protein product [Caenorhabditis bovis]
MDLQNLVNNVKSVALNIGERFTPILKESKFRETGVLTPEEFVAAGDHLVHHCPTWKWAPAANPSKNRPFLPNDKQYLITRNVPCHKRCKQMEYDEKLEKNEDEEEAIDLDDLVESGGLEDIDPNRFIASTPSSTQNVEVEKPRTYDLHICYDKFYQVPRLYLMGYDENRKPLTVEQTYEDFSADHANKTITVETHTSIDCDMPTVHPCKHAEMMKRLINQYADSGKELNVHEYLLLFLKFVQAVIPTIEYDYTRSIKI